MAFLLDAAGDWQDAVPQVLHHLGINVSAWHDACDAMGPPLAFLSLIIIDRNRFHPKSPVESPGGALRAFAAKAREGGLNLAGSVEGIRVRTRKGLQPRGPRQAPEAVMIAPCPALAKGFGRTAVPLQNGTLS